jgi:hypothetical protein
MQSKTTDADSDTTWQKRLNSWNDRTKAWNWRLIAIVGVVLTVFVFIASLSISNYRRTAFQNQVYCEVLRKGMSFKEVDTALDRIGKHTQVDITNQVVLTIQPEPTHYRLVLFEDARIDLPMGLGYNSNEKLLWVTRDGIQPGQVVQCP